MRFVSEKPGRVAATGLLVALIMAMAAMNSAAMASCQADGQDKQVSEMPVESTKEDKGVQS